MYYSKMELQNLAIGAGVGAFLNLALGGLDMPVMALLVLVILDYMSGMYAGFKTGCLSSQVGFKGIIKKMVIFVIVAFAVLVDHAIQMGHFLRTMTICAYALNEALSIVENADRIGWGEHIPAFLRGRLEQLRVEKTNCEPKGGFRK